MSTSLGVVIPLGYLRKKWPYEMAKAGYVVWAPISMYHNEISAISEINSFPIVWTKIISDGLTYGAKNLWLPLMPSYISSGLSAGGQIAFILVAYRPDIKIGVFAGAFNHLS